MGLMCVMFSSVTYGGDAKNYSWDSQTKEVREKYAMIIDTLMLIIIACVFF